MRIDVESFIVTLDVDQTRYREKKRESEVTI